MDLFIQFIYFSLILAVDGYEVYAESWLTQLFFIVTENIRSKKSATIGDARLKWFSSEKLTLTISEAIWNGA